MTLLEPSDLSTDISNVPDEELQQWIEDAEAIAAIYAPCIQSPSFQYVTAAKAIIKKAIVYDFEAKAAKAQSQQAGPFQQTNPAPTRSGTFYSPSQIEALKALCGVKQVAGAYSIQLDMPDTLPRY